MMLFIVTLISLLVHIYSTEYMHGDRRFTHYFAFLSPVHRLDALLRASADNTLQMLVGWELVGVCSFVLIGHWWEEKPNSDAALKAFLTNRVGDIGLMIGVIITVLRRRATASTSLHINEYGRSSGGHQPRCCSSARCACFAGVIGKSGQFPLHTWLPDAMAGPTPVSALIHAATMVVAGVYLGRPPLPRVLRGLLASASARLQLRWPLIGGITIFIGGAARVRAERHQEGARVLDDQPARLHGHGPRRRGLDRGVFHLFTHAFFKACLFLGAGSVSHAVPPHLRHEGDMGGLRKYMPITFWTFMIGIARAGRHLPARRLLVEGRDPRRRRGRARRTPTRSCWSSASSAAFMTAAYMTRALDLTFFGEYRGHGTPARVAARSITVPLSILAVAAVVAGFAEPAGLVQRPVVGARPASSTSSSRPFAFPAVEHAEFDTVARRALDRARPSPASCVAYLYFERKSSGPPRPHRAQRRPPGPATRSSRTSTTSTTSTTDIIVGRIKGPLARAAYWFNQNVHRRRGQRRRPRCRRSASAFVYRRRRPAGRRRRRQRRRRWSPARAGEVLRRMQTGKVQQYAAILFAGVARASPVVLVYRRLGAEGPNRWTDFLNDWGLTLAVFVPLVGALVMLADPQGARSTLHQGRSPWRTSPGRRR